MQTKCAISSAVVVASSLLGASALHASWAQAPPRDPGQLTPIPGAKPPLGPRRPATCTTPTGAGTTHGTITAAQTWTAAASPHILPFDTNITVAVTIEPCAVVRIAAGKTITIRTGGALVAAGAFGFPVIIEPQVAGAAWSTIRNFGGTLSLSHAIVRDGGAVLSGSVALVGALQMQSTVGTLHVDDVEIVGSRSQGVYINGDVGFDATSQNLRVHGAVGYPVHVYARIVGTVPSGNYTGNAHDAIAISGSGGAVNVTQTMYDRGVPYHVGTGQDGGRMDVRSQASGALAVLTIEPGVTIRFPTDGSLNVNANAGGVLIALGTSTRKIVFTSDKGPASAAGDWLGLRFDGTASPQSALRLVRVEFAGRASTTGSNSCPYSGQNVINDAAIRIFGAPQVQFVTESEILQSARHGIDRGWAGGSQIDFLASNTFTGGLNCKQTLPKNASGVCPMTVPCP